MDIGDVAVHEGNTFLLKIVPFCNSFLNFYSVFRPAH